MITKTGRRRGGLRAVLARAVATVAALAAVVPMAGPAAAYGERPDCMDSASGTLTVTPPTIESGRPVQVRWTTQPVQYCPALIYKIDVRDLEGGFIEGWTATGSSSRQIAPSGTVQVRLLGTWGPGTGEALVTRTVTVTLPPPVGNRRHVNITADDQQALFLQAIGTPDTTVRLADGVDLDLSYHNEMHIASGVHILGNRSTTNPGARIFTRTWDSAHRFFWIGAYNAANGVRISGLRIDGGNSGIPDEDDPTPIAISVRSSTNVVIENNELYNWPGAAVDVSDSGAFVPDRLNLGNAASVVIRGNYIHHNRHYRKFGYGVLVQDNAYAVIEENVFNENRHAITSDGLGGTGYLALRNLVLEDGGQNWGNVFDTHQFDVHGTEHCGGYTYYCGQAGEYFDVRHNAFYYVEGDVVKVRGEPVIRADVRDNVFAEDKASEAIVQTEGDRLIRARNRFGLNQRAPSVPMLTCDFDGDGAKDRFLATGVTWWFLAKTGQWTYLDASTKLAADVTLADHTGDGRCDVRVRATGQVFPTGRQVAPSANLFWRNQGTGAGRVWRVVDGVLAADRALPAVPAGHQLLGTADVNGDGVPDAVHRDFDGTVRITLLTPSGDREIPAGSRPDQQGTIPAGATLAGTGDFTGDGRADLLWRLANGAMEIWPAGESGSRTGLNYRNNPSDTTGIEWRIAGVADMNGDGRDDIVWRHTNGTTSIWFMDGLVFGSDTITPFDDPTAIWEIQTLGDFDGDGRGDILWRHDDGGVAIWFEGRSDRPGYPTWQNRPGHRTELAWRIIAATDVNADGRADIVWQNPAGLVVSWVMDGARYVTEHTTGTMLAAHHLTGALPQRPLP